MKIVIVGAGEVGQHLAKMLSNEEQDITLVDKDSAPLERIDANYNLMTYRGSPTSFADLKASGAGHSDLFIAVTPYEDKNLIACSIAKHLGAKKTLARVDNYEYIKKENRNFFSLSGIDDLIYPEYLAALEIVTALKRSWARQWFEIQNGELLLIGIKVDRGASVVGHPLRELTYVQHDYHISAITRNHSTLIPRGDDIVEEGDILYFTTTPEYVDGLREICGKEDTNINKVMILGGSRIAIQVGIMLGEHYHIKIIDSDIETCRKLPEKCPKCEIICGDGRDNDLLMEEGIEDTDAFLALTDSSEANILACLSAKDKGVHKTIAEVENIQFMSTAEALNINTIINKKLLASAKIFQMLLAADNDSSKFLSLADAEVCEIEVKEGAKVTKAPVKDLKLSRDMTIGGLVRDGHGLIVNGNTVIRPGDRVVVFCLNGSIHKIEKLFS